MSIGEQIKELRIAAETCKQIEKYTIANYLSEAADTIESLSAKLQTAKKDLRDEILKGIAEETEEKKAIWSSLEKPPYNDFEQELYLAGLKKAREIILQSANMERPAANCGGGWIPCKDRLPEEDGIYWAIVTLPKPVENGYSLMEAEQWYDNHTLAELCEWEKNAPRHTGIIKFEKGDWKLSTKRRYTKILAWQPIVEPSPYHEP